MTSGLNPMVEFSPEFKEQIEYNLKSLHKVFIDEIEKKRGDKITIVSI